jgi:broad specificity phosphatase PhoE
MNSKAWINGQIAYDSLDPLGFKQRVGLFLLLRNEPLAAIMVSELRRTRQTAALLAAHRSLKPLVYPQLNEFRGGIFQGICKELLRPYPPSDPRRDCDVPSDDPLVKRAVSFLAKEAIRSTRKPLTYRAPGGGESVKDVAGRLDDFLARFPRELEDEKVLIVGHGGTNRFLLAKLMGWDLRSARTVRQGHTDVFRLERKPNGGAAASLHAWVAGKWRACTSPPTEKSGLGCLSPGAVGRDEPTGGPTSRPTPR